MKIKIYQINMERDENRVAFEGTELLERYQGSAEINSAIYDKVYENDVECLSLEGVFGMFNTAQPEDYHARSLSVSDVVEVVESDTVKAGFYFCDSVGFKEVSFEPEKAQEASLKKTITVVLLEPGKLAREAEIDDTLAGMQKIVGGYIEEFCPFEEDVAFVCNEEGKIDGLPLNRAVKSGGEILDIIAGTCFICDCSGESFGSLSQSQLKRYLEQFKYPESFIRMNGEIQAIPFKPTNKEHER